MEIEQILKALEQLNLDDLKKVATTATNIPNQRLNGFAKAIESSDLNAIEEAFKLGVDFNTSYFWNILSKTDIEKTNKQTVEFFLNMRRDFGVVHGKNLSHISNDFKFELNNKAHIDNLTFDTAELMRAAMRFRLERNLLYKKFTNDAFVLGLKYLSKEKFSDIQKDVIKNFSSFNDFHTGYEDVHKFIKEQNLLSIVFEKIKSPTSIEFFVNGPVYKDYFEKLLHTHHKYELMDNIISEGDLEKLKILCSFEIPFPESKSAYSNLFQKTKAETLDAQYYVIENIPEITVGNQVILKTLLHASIGGNKMDMIEKVLARYSEEEILIIPDTYRKRQETKEVLFVKAFYNRAKLESELKGIGVNQEKTKIKI